MTFEEYVAAYAVEFDKSARRLQEETPLPHLERLSLKVAYLFHAGVIEVPKGHGGEAVRSLVAMLVNELQAFAGAIRNGSLHGAWHHVRAVTEIDASLHYLFVEPPLVAHRAEQFVEFARMVPWVRRRVLEDALCKGEISQAEFDGRNLVSDALIAHATPAQIQAWVQLFGVKNEGKLLRRRRWHDGTIEDLFHAKDPSGADFRAYEILCHGAHVSPVGHRLSNPSGPRMIGHEPEQVLQAIGSMFTQTYQALEKLNRVLDDELNERLGDEVSAIVERGQQLGIFAMNEPDEA